METTSRKPTLAEHLVKEQLGKIVQKELLGGYEVSLLQFMPVGLWVFTEGTVFGRARFDKLEIVAKMFVGLEAIESYFASLGLPKQFVSNEQWVFESFRKVGNDGVNYYRNHKQKEPESLVDLWLTSFAPPEVDFRDIDKVKKLAKQNIGFSVALQQLDTWLFAGISLGANFPELIEKIWEQEYETAAPKAWAEARKVGLDIPEKFTPVTLKEMEQQVLSKVANYATEYFPGLGALL